LNFESKLQPSDAPTYPQLAARNAGWHAMAMQVFARVAINILLPL
jgi:hypothetical protein